jgi:hypothetical protein
VRHTHSTVDPGVEGGGYIVGERGQLRWGQNFQPSNGVHRCAHGGIMAKVPEATLV